MRCLACGHEVPEGVFCTLCGAQQRVVARAADRRRRAGRFAANPDEHVAQPGVMSALFPHLGHDQVNEFRWALIGGVIVLFMLYVVGLITAALIAAAFLVPVLYVLYLYEVRVYRDAPVPVFGFTLGAGAVLGVVVSVLANVVLGPALPAGSPLGTAVALGPLLLAGVVLPIVEEALKPLPALVLRRRPDFDETIDGLVFGVAAGLGFALAQTVVQFSQVLTSLDVRTDPANWLFPLLTAALLLPLMHGSATGAITAAVWRMGRGHRGPLEVGAIIVAVVGHVAFTAGSMLLLAAGQGQSVVIVWQSLTVGALVIYVRYLLHGALLDEAASLGFARTVCPNCRREIQAAGFCPSCGLALTAVPGNVRRSREPLAGAPPSGQPSS